MWREAVFHAGSTSVLSPGLLVTDTNRQAGSPFIPATSLTLSAEIPPQPQKCGTASGSERKEVQMSLSQGVFSGLCHPHHHFFNVKVFSPSAGIKPRASGMLDQCTATELHAQPSHHRPLPVLGSQFVIHVIPQGSSCSTGKTGLDGKQMHVFNRDHKSQMQSSSTGSFFLKLPERT